MAEDECGRDARREDACGSGAGEAKGAASFSPHTPSVPSSSPVRPQGKAALWEVLGLWALSFLVILIFRAIPVLSPYARAAAALAFLYLPGAVVWRRGEDYRSYGADFSSWKRDVLWGLLACAAVLPIFALAFWGFAASLSALPDAFRALFVPYGQGLPEPALRLPLHFGALVLDQVFAVALPEEFFYRGYMQERLKDVFPKGRRLWGITIGPAFWLTALLFALGHLAIFQPWRLTVFFPALIFGALREKTGSILPSIIFHAASNLTLFVLEASFFGIRL